MQSHDFPLHISPFPSLFLSFPFLFFFFPFPSPLYTSAEHTMNESGRRALISNYFHFCAVTCVLVNEYLAGASPSMVY
jgi:hypothetical protein